MCQDPIWALVCFPAAPLSIQFPASGLGYGWGWPKALKKLLAPGFGWLSFSCCRQLGSEPVDRWFFSEYLLLSVLSAFPKKSINQSKKKQTIKIMILQYYFGTSQTLKTYVLYFYCSIFIQLINCLYRKKKLYNDRGNQSVAFESPFSIFHVWGTGKICDSIIKSVSPLQRKGDSQSTPQGFCEYKMR